MTICAAPLEDDLSPLPLPLSIETARRLGGPVARMQGGELLYVLGADGPCALAVSKRMKETVLCVNSGLPGMLTPSRARTPPVASIASVRRCDRRSDP